MHVINAIHAAISSADAFCVARLGMRSAGERHDDALVLFQGIAPENEDIKRNVKHLSGLLNIKTDAEYGERLFYENARKRSFRHVGSFASVQDATAAIKHAERLFDFVKGEIQKI